ncbi:cupin domain-containing protein [Streptomyces sp. JJ36]|uniref:cupin domain-containing protein n=1 Tax=Streptomyces sp. JJ36 TaxID=2736645 RepID=UPI001F1F6E92|nr:cupin domain-containing protein [Streptomyces sp. JJ36]MCF6524776.1 cupin domain-containing protein [Streptomyces sp. JJ36]
MQTSTAPPSDARIIRAAELTSEPVHGPQHTRTTVATPVSPATGATHVTLHVVRIAAHESFTPEASAAEENTAVVFTGGGTAAAGAASRAVGRGDAVYAPTGRPLVLTADGGGMTAYVWRTPPAPGRTAGADPVLFSSLWDDTTQLTGFGGTGQVTPDADRATMNFVFWPGTGSAQLCLHCGIQQPGETFNVHLHPHSDEAFIAFEGTGQMYLRDRWIDVTAGDILYAAPGVLHGARNPHTGPGARRFVTCGGPSPFDPALYASAGVSPEVR